MANRRVVPVADEEETKDASPPVRGYRSPVIDHRVGGLRVAAALMADSSSAPGGLAERERMRRSNTSDGVMSAEDSAAMMRQRMQHATRTRIAMRAIGATDEVRAMPQPLPTGRCAPEDM
jgi:hypothetical protein